MNRAYKLNFKYRYIGKIILYSVMFGLSLVFVYPFLYMIVTSLMTNEDLYNFTVQWVPRTLHWSNYKIASELISFFNRFKNTLGVTLLATFGQLISCSMAGYSLARYRFAGRKILFFIVILAMIVPVQTFIVPQYILYTDFGWLNTYYPFIIPSFFGYGLKGALFIFIFRQFYLNLPSELENAARVDGCGFLRTFFKIILPVSRSSYLVVLVLSLIWHWGDYFEPAMYISDLDMGLLASGLTSIAHTLTLPPEVMGNSFGITDGNALNNAVLMAGTFLVVLPILLAFCVLQHWFMQGIERTGLTGE